MLVCRHFELTSRTEKILHNASLYIWQYNTGNQVRKPVSGDRRANTVVFTSYLRLSNLLYTASKIFRGLMTTLTLFLTPNLL